MSLTGSENAVSQKLTELYKSYGYKLYKPACFEEYSLYQENKDFLIGKNVITFSDMSGRLMAMRPDVTLSLVRHSEPKADGLEKYYYSEKVYRQVSGGKEFKGISQIGAEIIGNVDGASVCEIAALMCETLAAVSSDYILDVSHMGFTEALLKQFNEGRDAVTECLKGKNLHDFYRLSERYAFPERLITAFEIVSKSEGHPKSALKEARKAVLNKEMENALNSLETLCGRLAGFGYGNNIKVDFSVTNNADYYNGEVFNGYVNGIYHRVLSGGRYDKLLRKLGKNGGAVGFALYLGELDRFFAKETEEVDYLIVYDFAAEEEALKRERELIGKGYSVRIANCSDSAVRYRHLTDLRGGDGKDD